MDRDCNKCVYSTREGGCRKFTCEGTKTVEDIRSDTIDEFYNRLLDNKNEINASNYPWNYIELVARKMTKQLKEHDNDR